MLYGLCSISNKAYGDFLWLFGEHGEGIHLLNWEAVCSPKNRGGLHIRIARDNNIVMLGNLLMCLATKESKHFVHVLHGKYLRSSLLLEPRMLVNSSLF